ncbi:MAG: DUF2723 domain-containing protein [Candidatus Goldbacteria bacterium]|nr:DUF2723 domain-containing protein [Candidatus Goldiibacteriota bacterium]
MAVMPDKKAVIASFVFIAVFFVYLHTLNPVFHANDSPETAACAVTLGIQHPPGYPLFSLVGKIFTFIPAGNPGFRVNLLAAFCGASGAALIFLIIAGIFRRKEKMFSVYSVSAAAAFVFAMTYTVWSESLSSKGGIYTLNAMLFLLVVYFLFKWDKASDSRYFYTASLIYGISLGNHWESMAVVLPGIFVYVLFVFKKMKLNTAQIIRKLGSALIFMVPGIFLYMYLIIRSNSGALLNWGNPADLKQLLWVIFRAQYTDMEKARDLAVIIKQSARVISHLVNEMTPAGLLLAITGAAALFISKRKKELVLFGVILISVCGALALYFNLKDEMIWIMDVFMVPVYASMAVFSAAAVLWLADKAGKKAAVIIGVFFILPFAMASSTYRKADQSRYYYNYDFGMNIIKSVDTPGIALLEGDFNVMPQMYFKYVAHRTEFCPVTTLFLYVPWGIDNLKRECPGVLLNPGKDFNYSQKIDNLMANNYRTSDIYVSVFRKAFEEFYPAGNAMLAPNGLMMKFTPDKKGNLTNAEANLKKLSYRNVYYDKLYMNNTTEFCVSNYSSAYTELGNAFRDYNMDEKAVFYLERAAELATTPTKAETLTHLGVQYSKMLRYNDSVKVYLEAIKIKPSVIEAYSNLAGVYNNIKEYDRAIDICEKGIRQNPSFAEVYNNMGIAYYYKGNKQKAIELLSKSLSLNPQSVMTRQNLEIIKKETGGR